MIGAGTEGASGPNDPNCQLTGYSEIHSAAAADAMIIARDPNAFKSDGTRIFVSNGPPWENRIENDSGWFFTRPGNAYVGIRVANGS